MNKKVAFIGPLPPPIGGVSVINESIQDLLSDVFEVYSFNTSQGNEREDLYSNGTFAKIKPQIKRILGFFPFARNDSYNIANLFVTTGKGFVREAIFIVILKLFRKKIIIHLHSKKTGEFFLTPFRIKILAYFLNKADKIIVLSDDHYEYFSKYFDENKMSVVENFVDYSEYICKIEDKVKEYLYVGRMSQKKGFFDLLDSISILKNEGMKIKFHILGAPENDRVEETINQYVKENELSGCLEFHGLTYGKEKYDLFKRCAYFVFPSQFENSPVVLKEAIASKMAIIASDIEANKIVLKPVDAYCSFNMGDANDLAKKLKDLFLDDEATRSMMEASSRVVEYDKKVAKKKLVALHNELEKGSKSDES